MTSRQPPDERSLAVALKYAPGDRAPRVVAKGGGVLAMFGAIAVLFLLPWLDTSRVRSCVFRPIYKWFMLVLVVDVIVLGFCGANPPEGFWVPLARIATLYYFFHFIVLLPILGKIERPLPLPPSIADAVLKKKAG